MSADRRERPGPEDLVAIGRIGRPHGVRGWVGVIPLTDFPERFKSLDRINIEREGEPGFWYDVDEAAFKEGMVRLKISGVNDRDAAFALKGAYVSVMRRDTVPLEPDEHYAFDLEGLSVEYPDGTSIGRVLRIERYPANDVLVVETPNGDVMVPALKSIVRSVEPERGRIVADLPEGLPIVGRDTRG